MFPTKWMTDPVHVLVYCLSHTNLHFKYWKCMCCIYAAYICKLKGV